MRGDCQGSVPISSMEARSQGRYQQGRFTAQTIAPATALENADFWIQLAPGFWRSDFPEAVTAGLDLAVIVEARGRHQRDREGSVPREEGVTGANGGRRGKPRGEPCLLIPLSA